MCDVQAPVFSRLCMCVCVSVCVCVCVTVTVKSLFSAPAPNYFNRGRTTGAKKRTALKQGRRLTFQWQFMDLRKWKRT